MLGHTEHDHPDGQHARPDIFKLGSMASFSSKMMLLTSDARTKLGVKNNLPLPRLLKEFGDLCLRKAFGHAGLLDYGRVLAIFGEMLNSDEYNKSQWPVDDSPLEYDLHTNEPSPGERCSKKRAGAVPGKRKRKTKKARISDPESETDMGDESSHFGFYGDVGKEDGLVPVMLPPAGGDATDVLQRPV